MYNVVDYFWGYIGSSWAFLENDEIMSLMGAVGTVGILMLAIYIIKIKSKKDSDMLTFIYTFLGSIIILIFLYGYIALPLSVLWMYYARQMTHERIIYYYVRSQLGHLGGWHEASEIDEKYDLDEICSEIEFNKKKMEEFYTSDKPIFVGYFAAISLLILCIIFFEGYRFFPIGV